MTRAWPVAELSAVSAIQYGYTDSARADSSGPRFLRITDIQNDRVNWDSVPYCSDASSVPERFRLADGDIVFARTGATTGKSFLVTEPPEAVFASYLIRVRVRSDRVLPKFVFYYFKTDDYWRKIKGETAGAAQGGFNAAKLGGLHIPVPPLAEQMRIVGRLDEALRAVDVASANTAKAAAIVQDLFESELNAAMSLCDGVEMTTLGSEVDLKVGFAFKSEKFTDVQSDVRLLRGDNIVAGALRWDGAKRYPVTRAHEFEQYALVEGDVVLAMDRPWVSAGLKRAQVSADDLPCLLVQRVARLRGTASLDSRFIYYLLGTRRFIAHLVGNQTGLGVPHISGQQIKNYEFRKPSLKTQKSIVERLDRVRDECQRLLRLVSRKQAAISDLRASILTSAFSGQL